MVTGSLFFCGCFIFFSTSPESPHNSSRSPAAAMLRRSSAPSCPSCQGQGSRSDPQETGFHNRQDEDRCG